MNLVFWQPFASFHQEAFLRALAARAEVNELVLRVEGELPGSRRAAGWREAVLPGVQVEPILPGGSPECGEDWVHVFTGLDTHPGVWQAYHRLSATADCRCFAYTEAPEFTGAAGGLRTWKYRRSAERLIRSGHRLEGVLAIGGIGVDFYTELLAGKVPVIPFGYFDGERFEDAGSVPVSERGSSLLVAGQLIRRKGIDLLIRALAECQGDSWRLRVAGDGPEGKGLRNLAARLGIADRVDWLGILEEKGLKDEMRKARCLMLPSRFDGWGMTVNEALRQGCPVRVSEMAGAAALVPEEWRMRPTVEGIRGAVREVLKEEAGEQSCTALRLARQTMGEVGAERMLGVVGVTGRREGQGEGEGPNIEHSTSNIQR